MAHHPTKASRLRARIAAFLFVSFSASGFAAAPGTPSVYLEDLTSFELRAAISSGSTTVLVPIGGTEQNGPHMALGKHNVRVRYLAGQIAHKLGNAIVAPVLAYVPEGAIFPPVAHMRFSGTISIADATFESILESAARSFKQHGFHDVVFLGDHGGYQKSEVRAAEKINKEWASDKRFHALALTAYYEASQAPYIQFLRSKGYSDAEIGTHAGLADTSLMLAIDKSLVRAELLAEGAKTSPADGVYGDPRKASAELGQPGLRTIIDQSVQAIQEAVKQHASR
ncbi:MAG: creatininase family protein [Rhodoferax sp.]|nr:creatininase family protein [Rhodoferax sp.]